MGIDGHISLGICARRNMDNRRYKVLSGAAGDSVEFAIVPAKLRHLARRLASLLEAATRPDFVIGLAPGGIATAIVVSDALDVPAVIAYKCRLDLPGEVTWTEPHCYQDTFYLYGVVAGMAVVLADDEVDSGDTLCNAIRSLRSQGVQVVDVACAVEVLHDGRSVGRERLQDLGLALKSVSKVDVASARTADGAPLSNWLAR
jgi:adenine/guanine phosphoribosyltransferase-like PRPP-binding protein